jgi:hypothetical protein
MGIMGVMEVMGLIDALKGCVRNRDLFWWGGVKDDGEEGGRKEGRREEGLGGGEMSLIFGELDLCDQRERGYADLIDV